MNALDMMLRGEFLPHGFCLTWSPQLLWTLVASDLIIAAAYYSIPLGLLVIVRRRRDLAYHWMFRLFALFIFACGTSHVVAVVNIWYPAYWADAGIKLVTAVASIGTAAMLWPLIPKVLALPSPAQIERVNRQLADEVSQRRSAQDALHQVNRHLEQRVVERTRELERSNAELARSNAELAQFAYVASHDLQEPLRMVSAYTQLIQRRYGNRLDGDAAEFFGFVIDGATRMQRMIDDLLELSRVSRPAASTSVDLTMVMDRVMENLRLRIAETGATVEVGPMPSVKGDATQMTQLFQNLLSNSLKFLGDEAPRISIDAANDGNGSVRIAVRDNGIGMKPEHTQRIFLAFERLHGPSEFPGSGIGLAICKRIVDNHGGSIEVETAPGKGSTFHVCLPAEAGRS